MQKKLAKKETHDRQKKEAKRAKRQLKKESPSLGPDDSELPPNLST